MVACYNTTIIIKTYLNLRCFNTIMGRTTVSIWLELNLTWPWRNRRGALGFSVLRFWLFFRLVFRFLCQKTSVFRFWCYFRFADFSFFSILFSVLVENNSGFSISLSKIVLGFSYFVLFGFRSLFDLTSNYLYLE